MYETVWDDYTFLLFLADTFFSIKQNKPTVPVHDLFMLQASYMLWKTCHFVMPLSGQWQLEKF